MDETKILTASALIVGSVLSKLKTGELICTDYAFGTLKAWNADVRSDGPDWQVTLVSASQVFALRIRA